MGAPGPPGPKGPSGSQVSYPPPRTITSQQPWNSINFAWPWKQKAFRCGLFKTLQFAHVKPIFALVN